MHSTNAFDTFIAVASDCKALQGTVPKEAANPSVAYRTFRLIHEQPYRLTSDDVIFTVHADRKGIPDDERPASRQLFFAKGQPCLRASDLGKRYGWGIHCDAEGRVALYGVESPDYQDFVSGSRTGRDGQPVKLTAAMRSSR